MTVLRYLRQHHTVPKEQGFSLIQITIILAVVAIALAATLPGYGPTARYHQESVTEERMGKIEEALRGFMTANSRLPCPADITVELNNAAFGQETPAASCTGANFSSGDVAAGAVPVATLNLPSEYVMDGWGRRFLYAVSITATDSNSEYDYFALTKFANFSVTTGSNLMNIYIVGIGGSVTEGQTIFIESAPTDFTDFPDTAINGTHAVAHVIDGDNVDITMGWNATVDEDMPLQTYSTSVGMVTGGCGGLSSPYSITIGGDDSATATVALVSYGANGHGAYPGRGGSTRVNAGSTDADELDNAGLTAGFANDFDENLVRKTHTSTFDDIVHYSTHCKGGQSSSGGSSGGGGGCPACCVGMFCYPDGDPMCCGG